MKPAPFEYRAPRSVDEAVEALAEGGEEARVLAGGQSLVPTMNFRLARPALLVDINRVGALDFLRVEDGVLRIGALARHAAFERPPVEGPLGALLARVARHVAHPPIRARGTFAGSLAHADPASEWCAVAVTLDAGMVARSRAGERVIPAGEFLLGALTTGLRSDEVLTEVRLPLLPPDARTGFTEFSRRAGDFALAMAVVVLRLDGDGIVEARVGIGGAAERAQRIPAAEQVLQGRRPDAAAFAEAADAVREHLEPMEDLHAPAEYRRDLARSLTRRALEGALAR